eukprot:gb/GECG01013437.1/.p1 GENE.gb/GECG01013437.1/~~gb/GECG01013437.1/.p1  ORF type:complete len:136 (+),score=7.80 gb/GECG01013437.1/:1-408(+)
MTPSYKELYGALAPVFGRHDVLGIQATLDYRRAALLLELNEARQEIVDDTELMWYDGQITSVEMHVNQFIRSYSRLVNSLRRRFDNMDLASLIPLTNEKITVQVRVFPYCSRDCQFIAGVLNGAGLRNVPASLRR